MFRKFEWQDAVKIILALSASGFALSAENKAGFISLLAMLVVWIVGFFARQYGYKPNKVHLTGFLFVASVVLTLFFQPVNMPPFPVWGNDLPTWLSGVLVWAGLVVEIGGQVFIWATANYNLLLSQTLKKIEPGQSA